MGIVEPDDYLEPTMVQELVDLIQANGGEDQVDIARSAYWRVFGLSLIHILPRQKTGLHRVYRQDHLPRDHNQKMPAESQQPQSFCQGTPAQSLPLPGKQTRMFQKMCIRDSP